jgi:hypothetical protein
VTLQYADGTLLFSTSDDRVIRNLKCVMMLFEQISGMKINFHKSAVIPINLEEGGIQEISHILNCPVGSSPLPSWGCLCIMRGSRGRTCSP